MRLRRALRVALTGLGGAALMVGDPSVSGQASLADPIVFVSRAIPARGHIADSQGVTGSLPGVGSISRFVVASPGRLMIREPNGSLRILVDGATPTSQSLHLTDVHAPEVSYDGRTIVFAGLPDGTYSAADRNVGAHPGAWRIYTINVDGTGLRQVTVTPPPLDLGQFDFESDFNRADDTDPNWLPDGRIVFSSTRWPAVAQYRDPRTTNLSPGAMPTASSGSAVDRLIDRRARTEATFEHWRSQTATGQWVQLTFPVAVTVRTVRLYGASAVSTIGAALVQLYADPAASIAVAQASSGTVADGGTDVAFPDVTARAVRVWLSQVAGDQASLAEVEVIAAGRGTLSPLQAPTGLRAIVH